MKVQSIQSPHNPNVKRWADLLESKGIERHQQFLVFGEKVILECLSDHLAECIEVIIPEAKSARTRTEERFEDFGHIGDEADLTLNRFESLNSYLLPSSTTGHSRLRVFEVPRKIFKTLDVFGTHFPILVMQKPAVRDYTFSGIANGLEIFLATQDPINVGAAIRSATAFGASKVVLLKGAASPFLPKASRAASGNLFHVPLFYAPTPIETFRQLANFHQSYFGLDMGGEPLTTFEWPTSLRLFIGEEGQGLSDGFSGKTLSIPIGRETESLNATVALSIALFSYRTQHPLAP